MFESLSLGYQAVNMASTVGLISLFVGVCAYGYATEKYLVTVSIEVSERKPNPTDLDFALQHIKKRKGDF